jgi:hypothetical protein
MVQESEFWTRAEMAERTRSDLAAPTLPRQEAKSRALDLSRDTQGLS